MISADSKPEEIAFLALAFHEIVGRAPVSMRSKNHVGVLCEDGEVVNTSYSGPLLERVIETGEAIHGKPSSGRYEGQPLIVVPIRIGGEVVGAVGALDISKGAAVGMMHKFRRPTSEISVDRCVLETGISGDGDLAICREDVIDLAMVFHRLVGERPLSMRSIDGNGVLIEDGKVVDDDYTGPMLEEVMELGETIRGKPSSGRYEGQPLIVVPIMLNCRVIGAVGAVDITKGAAVGMMHKFRR